MSDDLQLFQRISAGDEEAFSTLFHQYTPKLLPFVIKLTRNEQATAELIQETFMQLWLQRTQLNNVENPSAWIYRIASNLSVNYLKTFANRKRLLSKIDPPEGMIHPDDQMETKELAQLIHKAILLLPERRQEVYRLSREEGFSHQQIAEKLTISTNTVKNQIGTALKFIQQYINGQKNFPLLSLALLLLLKFFFKPHSPFGFFN